VCSMIVRKLVDKDSVVSRTSRVGRSRQHSWRDFEFVAGHQNGWLEDTANTHDSART
jgi:hypothetical protein